MQSADASKKNSFFFFFFFLDSSLGCRCRQITSRIRGSAPKIMMRRQMFLVYKCRFLSAWHSRMTRWTRNPTLYWLFLMRTSSEIMDGCRLHLHTIYVYFHFVRAGAEMTVFDCTYSYIIFQFFHFLFFQNRRIVRTRIHANAQQLNGHNEKSISETNESLVACVAFYVRFFPVLFSLSKRPIQWTKYANV